MKYLTLKNFEKAKAIVKERAPGYTDEEVENIAINAFSMASSFNITVEEALRNFGTK